MHCLEFRVCLLRKPDLILRQLQTAGSRWFWEGRDEGWIVMEMRRLYWLVGYGVRLIYSGPIPTVYGGMGVRKGFVFLPLFSRDVHVIRTCGLFIISIQVFILCSEPGSLSLCPVALLAQELEAQWMLYNLWRFAETLDENHDSTQRFIWRAFNPTS